MHISKKLLLFPLIMSFLPAFAFSIPDLGGIYNYFFIVLYIFTIILFIANPRKFTIGILKLLKKRSIKIFCFMFLFIALDSMLLSVLHVTTFYKTIRGIIFQFGLFIFAIYIYFLSIINKYVSYRTFFKTFIFLFWLNLVIGFIAYIGQIFNITVINNIFDFFANSRSIKLDFYSYSGQTSNFVSYGLPRLDNLYEEPMRYAQFLFWFLPLAFTVNATKFKIFKSTITNKIIKYTIVPFTIISIILTLSPIFIVFVMIFVVIYFHKKIIAFIFNNFIIKAAVLFTLLFAFSIAAINGLNIDFSNSFLSRIFKVLSIFTHHFSFYDFIDADESLAIRIINYINCFCVFLHHPFTGVGIGNVSEFLYTQYHNSPVPLSSMALERLRRATITGNPLAYDVGFIYQFLAEYGMLAFLILSYLHVYIWKKLNAIKRMQPNSFDAEIANCFQYILIALLINAFYDMNILTIAIHIIYVLIFGFFIYNERKNAVFYTLKNPETDGENNEFN